MYFKQLLFLIFSILFCSSCGNSKIFTIATDEYYDCIGNDSVISTYKEINADTTDYPLSFQMHSKLHYIKACKEKGISANLSDKELNELIKYYESSNDNLLHEAYASIAAAYRDKGDEKNAIAYYEKAAKQYENQLRKISNLEREESKFLLIVLVPSACAIIILSLILYNIKWRQRQLRTRYKLTLLERIEKEQAERSEEHLDEMREKVSQLDMEISKAAVGNNHQLMAQLQKQKEENVFDFEKTQREVEIQKDRNILLLKSKAFETIQTHLKNVKNIDTATWKDIDDTVNDIVPNFKIQLYSSYRLSKQEYKICLLIRFSLTVKEMATLLCKSDSAISLARKRLYKKLTGKDGTAKDMDTFVCSI